MTDEEHSMSDKWFGREPALWIQGIGAVLTTLVVFSVPGLNDTLVAAITAVLTAAAAAYTALHVTPVAPSVFAGVIGAGATLLAALGLHLTQQQTGAVTLAVAAVMAILTRAQQTPLGVGASTPQRAGLAPDGPAPGQHAF